MKVYNNRVVCDIKKAQWCLFGYTNQHDQFVTPDKKPKFSVHGVSRDPSEKAFNSDKTLKELAEELKIVDVWTPRIKIMFASNHYLIYVGKKAVAINDTWNKRIFNDAKKEMNREMRKK